jgi:hypothetical protein
MNNKCTNAQNGKVVVANLCTDSGSGDVDVCTLSAGCTTTLTIRGW